MLNVDDKLSFETIAKIFKTGYSRIPIYEVSRVSTTISLTQPRHWHPRASNFLSIFLSISIVG